jgi:ABC-2 type transport system permease protein
MRNVAPLTQRELAASFLSPIAYVVGCVFLLFTGYYFVTQVLVPGNEASMRPLFAAMTGILVFAVPLLTMRAVAEEFSTGTIETLMTAPVTDAEVILGKFFGVLALYAAMLATTIPHLLMMMAYSQPQLGVVLFSYVGMLLIGALYISVGLFASCCTRHQLLAAVIGMGILSIFTFLVDYFADFAGPKVRGVLMYVNVPAHFDEFTKGILDTKSLVFFVSTTVFFLFLATKVLESKRWR